MKDGSPLQLAPGAYASLPSHHVHQASCARACLLFSIADAAFDIHYVAASGADISLDQAMKRSKNSENFSNRGLKLHSGSD